MNLAYKKYQDKLFDDKTENILSSLEKTQHDFWNLDRESANFLYSLIKIKNAKNVLEIGTSNGYSGIWILKALKHTKGHYTTIEFWEKRQSVARNNFNLLFSKENYTPKIGSAIVVLEDLAREIENHKKDKFDFVFIDANKKEYIEYFKIIDTILDINGVIVADNILSHYEKVKDYVDYLYSKENYTSQIIDINAGMMISTKDF